MFHRRKRMLAPINTIKHYVQRPSLSLASGTILVHPVVDTVVAPATADPFSVIEGAVIKAIYIEFWIVGTEVAGVTSSFTLVVEKKRDLEPDMTFAQSQLLGAYPNKKNILYSTQGILGSDFAASPVPVIRQYILIPKGKQRFGLDDQFIINIAAINGLQVCGIATYKEYR